MSQSSAMMTLPKALSVNWSQVGALVAAQFRLDLRHPKSGRIRSSRLFMTLLSYGFSTLVLAFSLRQQSSPPDELLFFSLNFGMLVVLFTIASGQQPLMGNPKDHDWLLALPTSEGTQYVARLINIVLFFCVVFIAVLLPIGVLFINDWDGITIVSLLFTLTLGMVWTMAIGLALFWLLVLHTPYRWIKVATAVFQAIVILLLVIGYQLVGSIDLSLPDMPWWPGMWFVDLFTGEVTFGVFFLYVTLIAMGVLFVGYFPREFLNLLARLTERFEARPLIPENTLNFEAIESRLIRKPQTYASYRFAVTALAHDSSVRDRLWPVVLLPLAFAFFGWWTNSLNDLFLYMSNILLEPDTRMHPSLLIILFFSCQSLLQSIQFSTYPEASWIFSSMPVRSPRTMQIAAHHALNYRVLLPLFIAIWIILSLSMSGWHALIHVAFWWVSCLFLMRVQLFLHRQYPFSRKSDRFAISERFLPLLIAVPMAALFTAVQMLVFVDELVAIVFIISMAMINHVLVTVRRG